MYCHVHATVNDAHHAIGAYLNMAPYRQGAAGKGASVDAAVQRMQHHSIVTAMMLNVH